jgi:hypothetical protein
MKLALQVAGCDLQFAHNGGFRHTHNKVGIAGYNQVGILISQTNRGPTGGSQMLPPDVQLAAGDCGGRVHLRDDWPRRAFCRWLFTWHD